MKKIFLIIIILLTIGCSKEDDEEIKRIEKLINDPQKEEIKEEEYIDTNPIKVGLYSDGKLVKQYTTSFKNGKDIAVFNIVFSNLDDLGSKDLKTNWFKYYNEYSNINDYKIGFYIAFETNEKKYESLVLDPSAQYNLDPYLYPYIYDGIHAKGHYTHLTMKDINDETIYSTIKIYLHQKTNEITSPITLTVFTYKDNNDFKNNHYRGNSFYTLLIENKKS